MEGLEGVVEEFHVKNDQYHLPYHNMTALIPHEVRVLRMRLIAEEMGELFQAMHEEDLVEIADAIADLAYVVVGTAVAYGLPFSELFAEVHGSNMTKSGMSRFGKLGKGDDFRKPDISGVLRMFKEREET